MLGFLFNSTSANAKDYPQLYENRSSSDNVEITKLIDGPIDSLYSINRTGEFIAQANSRLWKINAKGQVIDYFSPDHFYASGLILEKEGFIDWVFTGDKQIKPYGETLDAKDYSDQKLFEAFDKADAIEFVDRDETGFAYIYQQGQVSILDISNRRDQIDDFYFRQSVSKDYNLRRKETDVKASRFKNYQQKNPPVDFLTQIDEKSSRIIKSVGFKKIANHYAYGVADTFFENTLGKLFGRSSRREYSYPVGYTQYHLSHQGEQLQFSVFSDKQFDSAHAFNFSLLEPKVNTASDLKFITINYRRHYLEELNEKSLLPYYEQDVGLYVVREKIPHNQNKNPQWQLSYSGLHSYEGIWGNISFAQSALDPVYYWFRQDRPIPAEAKADLDVFGRRTNIASPALKALPESITFHWTDFKADRSFRLVVNGRDAFFYEKDDTKVIITLKFDSAELTQAFQQLSSSSEPIQLNLHMEEQPRGAELLVHLQNSNQRILLKKHHFDYQEVAYTAKSPDLIQDKGQSELFSAYEKSLTELNPNAFLKNLQVLIDNRAVSSYASSISYYFALLSYEFNINRKFSENTHLVNFYLDKIHSHISSSQTDALQHRNLTVLASQGIFLGSNTRNPDLNHKIINTIVEQNFTLAQETNRAFLFNVACYYAINRNKTQMLKVINRTMELGRDPESYLTDGDFKDYWQDADFLNAIKKDPAQ